MQESINNTSMLKVGTILRGIYRIDSYLSSGGFGNTYVATNIEFDERIVIKEFFIKGVTQRESNQTTISVSNIENENTFQEQKEKFKKEARRLRQLHNSHIVSVHDLFEENGTAYYVMDYIDGESLAERLKRTGKAMTETEVNAILPQILDALKSVHDAGIWHLDLKPANIMLEKGNIIKLIDFGASKQLNTQKGGATTSTAISYTSGFAPREQMEQNYDKFGPWTDIYALGATLYTLLTNKRPPLPTDIDDDESPVKSKALPFLQDISVDARNRILWFMKTNRNLRPQSVSEIRVNIDKDEETLIAPTKDKDTKGVASNYTIKEQEGNKKQKSNRKVYYSLIAASFLIIFILFLAKFAFPQETNDTGSGSTDSPKSIIHEVENINIITPIGNCIYSGPVNSDNRPEGTGTAQFEDGRYYKGPFKNGDLTGTEAYFRYPNGDEYKGEFRNSSFFVGTYIIAEDGSYFKGTFKNGQPSNGNWYDKHGKLIE